MTLELRLALFDPCVHGGEAMAVAPVGEERSYRAGKPRHALCHQPNSFDWRLSAGKPHLLKTLPDTHFAEARARLNQTIRILTIDDKEGRSGTRPATPERNMP